ncbi:MAG: tRNA (cytidine(34)-2'-O)-methyltransferase [Leptospira sp.]|nr:tRNA (cytidine(34)-2'-O)-methyltransferase [Leptospira sp.]
MEVALFEPEIPPNTGNIARLCVNANVPLSIIGKPAFDLSEKAVRRAGLDYWDDLELRQFTSFAEFHDEKIQKGQRILLVSKFGQTVYWDVQFKSDDIFVFGKETSGLPASIKDIFPVNQIISIPMGEKSRSINLSNAVAIVLYEALRQRKFATSQER